MEDYSKYENTELTRAWNHLETCKLTPDVEARMDAIMAECSERDILAWDKDGNILAQCQIS